MLLLFRGDGGGGSFDQLKIFVINRHLRGPMSVLIISICMLEY